MSANPIALIIIAVVALVAAIVIAWKKSETFRKIVIGAWEGIKAAALFVWNSVLKPIFASYVAWAKVIGRAAVWLWRNVLAPAWKGIRVAIGYAWNNVIRPVFNSLMHFIKTTVPNAFRSGVSFIKKYWEGLKNVAKAPINFVIGTVVNKGIIGTLNKIAGFFGIKKRLGTIATLAGGGVMPGYAPGKDTIPAMLSPGEGVLRPEVVKALGPETIYAWNRAAKDRKRIQLFAGGGIAGMFGGPAKWLRSKFDLGQKITDRFGKNFFAKLLVRIPARIAEQAVKWVKGLFGSGGGNYLGKSAASSVAAILAVARRFYPGAQVSSGYRPGDPGYHGRGLAADLIGGGQYGMARIARGFYGMSGRLLELIHSPSWFVKNGQRVGAGYYRSVYGQHFNHVHVAARRDALFDQGGTLLPGWNTVYNGLGRREHLVPAEAGRTVIEIRADGSGYSQFLLGELRKAIRVRGGNAQVVLSTR
jgi:hypothetical protein